MSDPNHNSKFIPEETLRRLKFTVRTSRGDFKVNATEATLAKYVAYGIGDKEFGGEGERYQLLKQTDNGLAPIDPHTLLWDVIKDGEVLHFTVIGNRV